MKKTLQILGIIFAIILIGIACIAGYVATVGKKLDASAQQYVDAAVPAIVANWSEKELIARSAPQLMKSSSPEQLEKMFKWFGTLGPMKKYCGAKGSSNVFVSPQNGKIVSARFIACGQFEKGDATIELALLQNEKQTWEIAGFRVNSNALLPH